MSEIGNSGLGIWDVRRPCASRHFDHMHGLQRFICSMNCTRYPTCSFSTRFTGGGERALFEARACGAKIEIAEDNSKLQVVFARFSTRSSVNDGSQSLATEPIPDHELYYVQVRVKS
jgi:hypothetical protein